MTKKNLFTKHPHSIGETYFEHLFKAALFSMRLFLAATCCLIHSILPFLFKDSATDCIIKMVKELSQGKRAKSFNEKLEKAS